MPKEEESNDLIGIWIPKEILTMQGVNANEKIILSIVAGLTQKGRCFAKNDFFQDLIGWKKPKYASRVINGLANKGLILNKTINGIRYLELGFDLSHKKGNHPPTKRGTTLPQKGEHYNKEDNIDNRELSKFDFLKANYSNEINKILETITLRKIFKNLLIFSIGVKST